MRWLIYGGWGWMGAQFCQVLRDSQPEAVLILGTARLEYPEQIEAELVQVNPERIVNLAGRTHGYCPHQSHVDTRKIVDCKTCGTRFQTIDYLEDKWNVNLRDNLQGPLNLALIAQKYQIHLTYIGTGCIYNGYYGSTATSEEQQWTLGPGFREDDIPNYQGSAYSMIKGFTDQLLRQFGNVLNLRVRMPINTDLESPRNLLGKLIRYERICDSYNSVSILPELLPIAVTMSSQKLTGTFNFTNPGVISHNEILTLIKELLLPDLTWTNFSVEEQSQVLLGQRSQNHLNTEKLEALYPVKPIKVALRELLLQIKRQQNQ